MEERREKQIIQQAFESSLSGLQEDVYLAQRVLIAARQKGEEKVKKKLSVSLVLMIALLFIALTALAIGLGIDEIWKNSFAKMNTTGAIHTLSYPQEGDMTAEEAIALAREAVTARYGTTDAEFDRMGVYPNFIARGWDEETPDEPAQWRIHFSSRQDVNLDLDTTDYGPDGEYRVYLNAENREILFCNWYTNDFWTLAQRVWDCGSHDEVYRRYHQPEFYHQPVQDQAYWTQQLQQMGYEVRGENSKYHDLLLAADTDLLFTPLDELLDDDEPQAAAAWQAVQQAYGLDTDLMKQYAYAAVRPGWQTGTDDICLAFQYEEQFLRVEIGEISDYANRLFDDVNRLGIFMVSFEPGTTQVKNITHLPRSESMRQSSITTGRLLEKTDWSAAELADFDQHMTALERAVKRMDAAGCDHDDMRTFTHELLLQLGGDARIYTAAPEDFDMAQWLAEKSPYDALIPDVGLSASEARAQYGDDTRFWPLEVQAALLASFSAPREGEMTQEEAEAFAVQAVIDQMGKQAIDKLGDYAVGFQLYRFHNEGEVTRWHVFITDDPSTAQNGWQVIFAFRNGELWDAPAVQDIALEGVG